MKKYISNSYLIVTLALVVLSSLSCKKLSDFGDTNISPNGVAEPILSALLTNALNSLSGTVTTQPPAYFCQYLSESTYPGVSRYTSGNLQIAASGIYSTILQDLQVVINKSTDPSYAVKAAQFGDPANLTAIATLTKTYNMWTVTDRWGDVPYTEALKGASNLLPKYDEQEQIYNNLFNEIEAALGMINVNSSNKVKGDIIYSGDMAKWAKFGNSLRILIAIRTSKRFPNAGEKGAIELNKSLNSAYGIITSNADNFSIKYPGGFYKNPYEALHVSQDVAVSLTFTDALTGLADSRKVSMASLPNGAPYGLSVAAPVSVPYARTFDNAFANEAAPMVILSAASIKLAKAEAYERGWVPGKTTLDAQAEYNDAITTSFAQWNQPVGTYLNGAANYLTGVGGGAIGGASVAGSNSTTTSKLDRIGLQMWISFYPAGIQGWSSWRRTGMPNLKPSIYATNTGGKIPRRYTYGIDDYTTNEVEVDKAVAKIPGGLDSQDARVWWDK